jgi:TetR/AcrR family transcriptional regulator, cholesterol catabolism regulator
MHVVGGSVWGMARQLSKDRASFSPSTEELAGPAPSTINAGRAQAIRARTLRAVLKLLETKGYENTQLSQVAEKAHTSLATIYKYFPSRDELMVAAIELWMDENVYQFKPLLNEPTFDALMRVFRTIYEPWVNHPRMLDAFERARVTTHGSRLIAQGQIAVVPILREILGDLDPTFVDDLGMILIHVNSSVYSSVASGQMKISDALPTFERTLSRILTVETKPRRRGAQSGAAKRTRSRSKVVDS